MELLPKVSVIVLNYNGKQYLPSCLDSLQEQTYPRSCFEVIVSDNGSTDGSVDLLKSYYPHVRVIENKRNRGFSIGNNVAIRESQGKYVVLLNNDTRPHRSWLENLVAVARDHPGAGLVTSHLQLLYDQLSVSLQVVNSRTDHPEGNLLRVFGVDTGLALAPVQYLRGFGPWVGDESERYRLMNEEAVLGVPVPPCGECSELELALALAERVEVPVRLSVSVGARRLAEWTVSETEPVSYSLSLYDDVRNQAKPLVQNAGSVVFSDGSGRDRGTFVCGSEVFHEEDSGQYSKVEEVAAGCGAALLLRRKMLDDVGLLDESFFMYYEDTDLSLRARRKGWKVMFAPGAIVRHVHCGTSEEWSPRFVYLTDRNRLAMLFKNGGPHQIWRGWRDYLGETVCALVQTLCLLVTRKGGWRLQLKRTLIRFRVVFSLVAWLPSLVQKRRRIQRTARIPLGTLQEWFIQSHCEDQ